MRCVMIHYNEIGLKGKNQPLFVRRLDSNVLRATAGTGVRQALQQARTLGTYEISIIPDQDCCRLFVPRHPATCATLEAVRAAESRLEIGKLVQMGLDRMELQAFEFPETARPAPAVAARHATAGGG